MTEATGRHYVTLSAHFQNLYDICADIREEMGNIDASDEAHLLARRIQVDGMHLTSLVLDEKLVSAQEDEVDFTERA